MVISDDDAGVAMFNVPAMAPGQSVDTCIVVTYSGSLTPADVKLYTAVGGTGLANYLDLQVDIGTGGSFGSCSGFTVSSTPYTGTLAGFAASYTDFATGLGGWSPAATPESRTYRFTLDLQDNNAAQGLDATATFTWEAQNQ